MMILFLSIYPYSYNLLDNHVIGDGTNLVLSEHLKGQKYLSRFFEYRILIIGKVFDQKSFHHR